MVQFVGTRDRVLCDRDPVGDADVLSGEPTVEVGFLRYVDEDKKILCKKGAG